MTSRGYRNVFRLLIVLIVVFAQAAIVRADPLRIASVRNQKPFSMLEKGQWTGFTIALWDRIAATNHWQYVFVPYDNEDEAVAALAAGQVDVVAAATSITGARLQHAAFSLPYFRTGLQIMVNESRPYTYSRLREDLAYTVHSRFVWVMTGVVLALSVLVYFFERRYNPHFPQKWPHGVAEAFYYVIAVAATATSRRALPGPFGALAVAAWMIIGTITVAFITSVITNFMASDSINSRIGDPRDLIGKVAGTVAGTASADYLRQHFVQASEYPTLKDAVDALVQGKVAAVVGDSATLQYYDQTHPELPITEVGPVFEPQWYGFAMQIGSSLQQPVDQALFESMETGERGRIGRRFFGEVYSP